MTHEVKVNVTDLTAINTSVTRSSRDLTWNLPLYEPFMLYCQAASNQSYLTTDNLHCQFSMDIIIKSDNDTF